MSTGRAALKAINGSRLETTDTGHVVFGSDPDRFLELILPFLDTSRWTPEQRDRHPSHDG
jgi:hypothetical protein